MLSIFEFVVDMLMFFDGFYYWRIVVGFFTTGFLCGLVVYATSDEVLRWVICVPLALLGVVASLRWEMRSGDRGRG